MLLLSSQFWQHFGQCEWTMWEPSIPDARYFETSPVFTNRYVYMKRFTDQVPDFSNAFDYTPVDGAKLGDGCTMRVCIAGVGGSVLGLLMGGFFHAMAPMNVDTSLSTWEQIKQSYKGFGQNCTRMSRNFGKVGCIYSGVECALERERGRRDVPNAMYAGCVTGGILAFQSGPSGMALGCGGFAVFSAAIEMFMEGH